MNNGKQITVIFHVYNTKVSHIYMFEITLFVCYLSIIIGNKLVFHREKVHDYLGINFDFSEKGKVKIDIIPLLENVFESFPEDIGATATSPAGDNLF